jgi:histidine triad (HIT) family protein
MNDCLFCKIILKKIPSAYIYEDADTYAFADIHPNNPGHTLIVPKKHYSNLYDTPDETLGKLMAVAKQIGKAAKGALAAEGINIAMNNDLAAGQIIFHSHIHVIPRFKDDGYRHWKGRERTQEEIEHAAQKIKAFLEKNARDN